VRNVAELPFKYQPHPAHGHGTEQHGLGFCGYGCRIWTENIIALNGMLQIGLGGSWNVHLTFSTFIFNKVQTVLCFFVWPGNRNFQFFL
jgi:hypothetical protein